MDKTKRQTTRREFLLWLGITGLGLNEGFRLFDNIKEKQTELNIYNLHKDVHEAKYKCTHKGKELSVFGQGIFHDDYYLSMAHIPDYLNNEQIRTGFGKITVPIFPKDKTATIGKVNLETLTQDSVSNGGTDVYIAKPDRFVKNFPCKPSKNIYYGQKVYLIGNPGGQGINIRKGYVSDLDGFGKAYGEAEHAFGVDFPVHPGDSGCPVVSKGFKLLGLAKYDSWGKFGYINKIGLYLDAIQDIKNTVRKPIKYEN